MPDSFAMQRRHSSVLADFSALVWANGLFSFVLIAVVIISGQYRNLSFWLATAAVIILAYFIIKLPDHLKPLRYPLIFGGLLFPGLLNLAMRSPAETTPDISAASTVFLMALFWLPVIRHAR